MHYLHRVTEYNLLLCLRLMPGPFCIIRPLSHLALACREASDVAFFWLALAMLPGQMIKPTVSELR